ncbi:MAG: mycothiol transferase [Nocardioides sp.]
MSTPATDLLIDALGRVRETVHEAVEGLGRRQLTYRVDAHANTICWLVWHLTRIEDDHIAGVAGSGQIWLSHGWVDRFALPLEPRDHGYGHSSEQVAAVDVEADLLLGYHDAAHDRAVEYLQGLGDDELPRIVDRSWTPPVTLAVRLVSVANDCAQHAGQAAFVRGIVDRAG